MLKFKQTYFSFLLSLALTILLGFSGLAQADIPPKPTVQTSVYDDAKILSSFDKNALEQKLINYSDTTSTQIVVATVNTIQGENIALYAAEWAHQWGIGQAKEDNGVFILVAKDDRKLTIQTGYGVEHLLTDALSKRIIENIITPEFKQGNYYEGLDRGTGAIIEVLRGQYKDTRQRDSEGSGIPIWLIILFFIILMIILSNRNKGGGNRGRKRNDVTRT
ncbi:MAG: TPM domain-containing protein, partial [Flavobacteriaceae bacterium]|nr:TPM domain-containing protein [Flavobacteriaceae bacterium]